MPGPCSAAPRPFELRRALRTCTPRAQERDALTGICRGGAPMPPRSRRSARPFRIRAGICPDGAKPPPRLHGEAGLHRRGGVDQPHNGDVLWRDGRAERRLRVWPLDARSVPHVVSADARSAQRRTARAASAPKGAACAASCGVAWPRWALRPLLAPRVPHIMTHRATRLADRQASPLRPRALAGGSARWRRASRRHHSGGWQGDRDCAYLAAPPPPPPPAVRPPCAPCLSWAGASKPWMTWTAKKP